MPKFENISESINYLRKNVGWLSIAKKNRLIKQLENISETLFSQTIIKTIEFSLIWILIKVMMILNEVINKIRLDKDYPYTSPQIFYLCERGNCEFGYCKDLFGNLFVHEKWGPSYTLPNYIQNLPKLANGLLRMQRIVWKYHDKQQYLQKELLDARMKLFKVKEYKWEYVVFKIKYSKILALTPDCCLIFQENLENRSILKLDMWLCLKDILLVKVKAGKKKYTLQLHYRKDGRQDMMVFGGLVQNLETILEILNPIYSVEKRVRCYDKDGIKDYDEAIKSYSSLIEHYSLVDKKTAGRYMEKMKRILGVRFSNSEVCIANKVGMNCLSGK